MKTIKKSIAVFLCLITLISVCSVAFPVFAEEIQTGENVISQDIQNEETTYILSEVIEKREETAKHFLMSDGTYMAAEYSSPVHYRNEDGEWIDYDNNLSKNRATDEQEALFGQSTVYETNNEKINVVFAEKANSNCLISIETDKYPISWNYQSAKNSRIKINDRNQELTGDDAFLMLENISKEAIYENIYPNVDLQFVVGTDGTKENIILKNNNAQNIFTVRYDIRSLQATVIDEKTIQLVDGQDVIYTISAPYMIDANGAFSEDVSLSVKKNHNGKLTVDITADEKWLSDESRVFPVTVDPTVITKLKKDDIDSVFIASSNAYKDTNFSTVGHMFVGRESSSYNYCRSLFKFTLPTLNKGDMVVAATMSVYNYETEFYSDGTPDMQVNAHMITSSWSLGTVKWSNQPSYSSTVSDYEFIKKSAKTGWRNFDISSIVKQWYENPGTNYGILLKSSNESGTYAENCVKANLWTERYNSITDGYPRIAITYRNNKGLEDYWTYTTLDAGTAGTAYINDYTGNLVFIHGDVSTTGELMPISLEHVYNGYMADQNAKSYPHSGRGNKLSLQQTVKSSSEYGLSGESLDMFPYAYEDGDGTVHYFYKKTENSVTKYVDEDGLNLELKKTTEGYTITDKSDNIMTFNSDGNLESITDAEGRTAKLTYLEKKNTSGVSNLFLNQITDGAGHTITLTYNTGDTPSNCQLTKITGPDGRSIEYSTSSGRLARIKYPDGTQSTYTYDDEGSMLTACSSDGYKLTFTYTTDGSKRVQSVTESVGSTNGQKIVFSRNRINQTVIRTAGKDAVYGNSDDILSTYQFDNFGRTVSVKSRLESGTSLGAEKYDYTTGSQANATDLGKRNRVSASAATGKNPNNLLVNHSFENSGGWTDYFWVSSSYSDTGSAEFTGTDAYLGAKSVKVNVSASANDGGFCMYRNTSSNLTAGETYTLSGYIKTDSVTARSGASQAGACFAVKFSTESGVQRVYSNKVTGTTDTSIDAGWQRISMTFTVPEDVTSSRVALLLNNATGTAYFDCVQLEKSNVADSYNLLENPSFENGATSWTGVSLESSDVVTDEHYYYGGSHSYKLTGNATADKYFRQTVKVKGTEKDTYILSAYALANSVPGTSAESDERFDISIKISYNDGTSIYKRPVLFNPDVNSWQYSSGIFTLSDGTSTVKIPVSITVYCNYRRQINTCYFDCVSLIKEPAPTYSYDSKGNLVSAQQNAQNQSALSYDSNNNLTSFTDERESQYTYTYSTSGNKHRLLSAVSKTSGVKYEYTYNSSGNVTAQKISNSAGTAVLRTGIGYTSASGDIKAGAYVLKETDQHGYATTYNYNLKNGRLNSVTDREGNTTSYTYDNNSGVVKSVSSGGKTVSYTYDSTNTKLSKITHNGFDYNFEYDVFGKVTKTKVDNVTLMTNTYQANNGNLTKSTYGNGDYTEYEYNSYGQTTRVKKNGSTKYYWRYNSTGQPYLEYDYENNLTQKYEYDSLGRLVRQYGNTKSTDVNRFIGQYRYDKSNNVTKVTNKADGLTLTAHYSYNDENIPTKTTMSSSVAYSYAYDSLNRLSKTSLQTTASTPIEIIYSYCTSDRNGEGESLYRTTQIRNETIDGKTYRYDYDKNGNITKIYEKTASDTNYVLKQSYSYDSLGQLVRVNDKNLNKTILYTYDNGGNMLSQKEYAYTTGTVGTATKTVSYGYNNSAGYWGDKLRSITTDGTKQSFTYDKIGNPLTYRDGMSFTWQGRQMKTADLNGTAVSYKYNSDGLRSYKKVGSTVHEYEYLGDKLMYEKRGSYQFHYRYDAFGNLAGITREDASGNLYRVYVLCNSRGDVLELRNQNGTVFAKYVYDAWGNVLHVLNSAGNEITSTTHLANQNPFRYRGYYYDSECGLYYLQSRYYDPVTGRFVNADGQIAGTGGDVNGYNLYAYCFNNPVNASDSEGEWPSWAKKVVAAVAVVAVVAVVAAVTVSTAGAGTAVAAIAVGAAKGAAVGMVSGAAIGAASGAVSHRVKTGSWKDAGNAALNGMGNGALSGAISGTFSGAVGGYLNHASSASRVANCSNCFIAGTTVLTLWSNKKIEDVKSGDYVYSTNPETGETTLKKVVQTFVNETNELVHVYVNGEEIVTTPEHPFYVSNCGWVGAINLRAGDKLVLVNGEYAVVEQIQHEILEQAVKVYNFEVEDFHTYYVSGTGVLVHNACTGSYEITFKSGKNYVGKGGQSRMNISARAHSTLNNDEVVSSVWTPAPDTQSAFVDEYFKMAVRGVNNPNTYNKIWSPGRKIFFDSIS